MEYYEYSSNSYLSTDEAGDYRVTITDNSDSSRTESFDVIVADIWGEQPASVESIAEGKTKTAETTEYMQIVTYQFVAPEDGEYHFTASSEAASLVGLTSTD